MLYLVKSPMCSIQPSNKQEEVKVVVVEEEEAEEVVVEMVVAKGKEEDPTFQQMPFNQSCWPKTSKQWENSQRYSMEIELKWTNS